jgi:hypothetical protein
VTECALGEVRKGAPAGRECRVGRRLLPWINDLGRGVETREVGDIGVLDESFAPELVPREPECAARVLAGNVDEVVVHAKRAGHRGDPLGDVFRDRDEHHLGQHHVVHQPLPVRGLAPLEHACELVGSQRFERSVVDVVAGDRLRDRAQQRRLHVAEPRLRRHRRGHAATHGEDLVELRRRLVVLGERVRGVGGDAAAHGRGLSGNGWRNRSAAFWWSILRSSSTGRSPQYFSTTAWVSGHVPSPCG